MVAFSGQLPMTGIIHVCSNTTEKLDGYKLHGVVRLNNAGEVLPGRWPDGCDIAFAVQDNRKITSRVFEVLSVKESCSLNWVHYDASSGNAMPSGAILGGHLVDGTPLYVAIPYVSDTKDAAGYYNHETRIAICYHNQVENTQGNMKILVAQ